MNGEFPKRGTCQLDGVARGRSRADERQGTAMEDEMFLVFMRTGSSGGIPRARPAIMFILRGPDTRARNQWHSNFGVQTSSKREWRRPSIQPSAEAIKERYAIGGVGWAQE